MSQLKSGSPREVRRKDTEEAVKPAGCLQTKEEGGKLKERKDARRLAHLRSCKGKDKKRTSLE